MTNKQYLVLNIIMVLATLVATYGFWAAYNYFTKHNTQLELAGQLEGLYTPVPDEMLEQYGYPTSKAR